MGSNYNFFWGAWLQKYINIQGSNRKYYLKLENGAVSLSLVHCLLQKTLHCSWRRNGCSSEGGDQGAMSTADISPAVTPSLQRKTLSSSGYKSQKMYCTGKKKKNDRGKKKNRGRGERKEERNRGGGRS